MKEKNLLDEGTKIPVYRNREQGVRKFFIQDEKSDLVDCENVTGLIDSLKPGVYNPEEWFLFIDCSIRSLKALLRHNTNILAPISIAHYTAFKESYDHSDHNWLLCGDLKIMGVVLGMQSRKIKYLCFVCLFDTRDQSNHNKKKKWPERKSSEPGSPNVLEKPLADVSKIINPP